MQDYSIIVIIMHALVTCKFIHALIGKLATNTSTILYGVLSLCQQSAHTFAEFLLESTINVQLGSESHSFD